MKFHINEDFETKTGVISNSHGFLYRHLDTGFKTKWSGYWTPPYKFLDYYAIKINGIWLDRNTLKAVDYGEKITYHHETDTLYIKETIETPKTTEGFQIHIETKNKTSDPKAVHIEIEPGIDIRRRDQNISNNNYIQQKQPKELKIKSQQQKLTIKTQKEFQLKGEPYNKTHYPGEKQKCYIPGKITLKKELQPKRGKKTSLTFEALEDGQIETIEEKSQEFLNNSFSHFFDASHSSLQNLVYTREETGIAAGHPWFQNFWGRDTFWSLLGLIDLGYFELSHQILENYADKEGFPTRIKLEGENEHHGGDEPPLFIIASSKLQKHYKISEKIEKKQKEAFKHLEMRDNKFVDHGADSSWMDTLERPAPNIDIQSLWLKASNEKNKTKIASKLKEGLREFKKEDYLKDNLQNENKKTINAAIPLMFGQFSQDDAKKYLDTLNGEFSSRYGARTLSFTDPNHEPSGYHTGSVWGLTTGWAAIANFNYGKHQQGKSYLEKFGKKVDEDQLGGFPELVDAENGNSLGCSEQAWSAALFTHAIDTHMLGIKPEDNKILVEPSGPVTGTRKNKRIGDTEMSLRFNKGSVEVLDSPEKNIKVNDFDNH